MNLKKGKTKAMLFSTAKSLNKLKDAHLNIEVGESTINFIAQYKDPGILLTNA